MNSERWRILSEWHNTWLVASADTRATLRASLATQHPDLVQIADDLAASSDPGDAFLETPALVLAAGELAELDQTLPEGSLVGPYRIVTLLARGGMGDVYRAADPRLGRDVALKMLTNLTGGDGLAVERFLQEARVTASLDHPNIVKVFDIGTFSGRPYLVAELLDGETLRAVIARGPTAPSAARDIARAVTTGLAAAHARGLVHRDLKPENIFVTAAGIPKILDFGIAKLAQDPALPPGVATLTGIVLGTAGYVAPEQVRGDPVDARTDLFALGSIVFEVMTGRRAFAREHTIDTLHAIVHDEPPDLLPSGTTLSAIVKRLLAKAPDERFQTAPDLLWALAQPDPNVAPIDSNDALAPFRHRWTLVAAVGLLVLIALGVWSRQRQPSELSPPLVTRFTWTVPNGMELDSAPVVSPDGRRIAFTAGSSGSMPRLFVRALDSRDAVPVLGTDGAKQPFWSPDGASLAFFARGTLMRVAAAGGVPVVVCDAPDARGGAWSPNGTIVFGPDLIFAGLSKVSASGGRVEAATVLDVAKTDNSHRWPVFLPDGIHFLFHVRAGADDRRGVYVARIDQPASTPGVRLFQSESEAAFVATSADHGVLLSAANGQLEARAFNTSALRLEGDPRLLPIEVGGNTPYHPAMLSASRDLLATVATPMPYGVQLGTVARDGSDLHLSSRRAQNWPRLSPDGTRMALQLIDPVRGNPDIWIQDLTDGSFVRITTAPGNDILPVWSPDGRRVAYGSGNGTERRLSIAAADGTGILQELLCPDSYCEPTDWSADGQQIIVNARGAMAPDRSDVWSETVDTGHATRLLNGPFAEYDARLSPDGQWLAYVSDETGRAEVSVRAMTGAPRRLSVSNDGGGQPVWRRDGRELFYVAGDGHLRGRAVRLLPRRELGLGPIVSMGVPLIGSGHWSTQYDFSPDGRRVYFTDHTPPAKPRDIEVVMGWRALVK